MNRERKLRVANALLKKLPLRDRLRYGSIFRRLRLDDTYDADDAVLDMLLALDAGDRKRASDRRTDARRRVLVGARVPRDEAEDIRRAAALEGLSVYAYVRVALLAASALSCARAAGVVPGPGVGAGPGAGVVPPPGAALAPP